MKLVGIVRDSEVADKVFCKRNPYELVQTIELHLGVLCLDGSGVDEVAFLAGMLHFELYPAYHKGCTSTEVDSCA